MRQDHLTIDEHGVTRRGWRETVIPATDVRNIHVFADADGTDCLVVRGKRLRLLPILRDDLASPAVRAGARALVEAVRNTATVDPEVDRYLAAFEHHVAS